MAYNKVIYDGNTLIDLTDTTATANKVLNGFEFYDAAGVKQAGTIPTKSQSDLTVSGPTVNTPSGYYATQATKSVASGSAGTPTATKGSVSNHSISITPSVTNTTGYITGSTKTGTAVKVSASELVSGNKAITKSGTGIDVADYSTVSVNLKDSYTATFTSAGDQAYANVKYNNVRYYTNGDWFGYNAGDSLEIYCAYGDTNGIYIDGTRVAYQLHNVVTYTYTLPARDIEISCSKSYGASYIYVTTVSPKSTIKYEKKTITPDTSAHQVEPTGTYMAGAGTITLNRTAYKAYLPLVFPSDPVVGQTYQLYIHFDRTGKERTYTYHGTYTWNGFEQNITIPEDGVSRTITGYFEDSDDTYFVFNLGTTDDDDETETAEVILADLGYDYRALLCVEVEPIPSDYVIPTGTLNVVSNGTYNVKNYASALVAVPASGADLPIFNIQWDSTWTTRTVTCNETFAQCWNRYNSGIDTGAYIIETVDGDSYVLHEVASIVDGQANNYVTYTISSSSGPIYDIVYHANGTIEVVDPSTYTNELNATANGSYYPDKGVYTYVTVNVPASGTDTSDATLNSNGQLLNGVTAYSKGTKYTGNIPTRTSSNLTVSGATVTVPSGYYSNQVTKSVAPGSATTPDTTVTANPSISVNSTTGLITATASATNSVTPSVSAGYVSSGTAGTITVSGSNTSQLTVQAAKTVTPTKSSQTAVAAGRYTTGAVKVAAIPAEYITTSDATAVASDIAYGKTAYVNGSKITGTNRTYVINLFKINNLWTPSCSISDIVDANSAGMVLMLLIDGSSSITGSVVDVTGNNTLWYTIVENNTSTVTVYDYYYNSSGAHIDYSQTFYRT